MTPNQLRQKYLDFFAKHGHAVIPSSALVPENDPSTLFTSAGMQPLVPYLLGEEHPLGDRLVDSQKSFRSQDIEEVGDNRHTTFFEMLGNWSLGSYFKKEQLTWIYEFFVEELKIDSNRLYASVYKGDEKFKIPRDDEAIEILQEIFTKYEVEDIAVVEDPEKQGLVGRIYLSGNDNWWSRSGAPANMPAGEPGGPDSEIFYDFGAEYKFHENSLWKDQICHPNCDCGRFLEIGNSVFMQFTKDQQGKFVALPKKNIDFGGGFERILAVLNNDPDVFKTDLFQPIIKKLEKLSDLKYQDNLELFRVIADHVRAAVMLAADGVYPGNKAQGYFARRLIRRAIRHAKNLGINKEFLAELVPIIADIYQQPYPEVKKQEEKIKDILQTEERKFLRTLEKGLREFDKLVETQLIASEAFKLFESYGFPLELSIEEAANKNIKIEKNIKEKFEKLRAEHAAQSRSASAGMFKGGLADQSETTVKYHTATHLLHAALRKILGKHVEQKGSNITAERLRFDFSHPQAMTAAEKQQVEKQINDWINKDLVVTKKIMNKQEALDQGAMAFFAEKYPDEVSVYTIWSADVPPSHKASKGRDWVSRELCGGPHVQHTAQIGKIKISKEKAVAAGVRRVYLELDKQ